MTLSGGVLILFLAFHVLGLREFAWWEVLLLFVCHVGERKL